MLSGLSQRPLLSAFAMEDFEFPAGIHLQQMPLFPKWHLPLKLMVVFMAVAFVYTFLRDVLQPYVSQDKNNFYKIPILVLNKVLPWTSITLLALVYLPGILAALVQLHRGEQSTQHELIVMLVSLKLLTYPHTIAFTLPHKRIYIMENHILDII